MSLLHQIGFSQARGLRGNTARELLKRIGSVDAFFECTRSQLVALTSVDSDIYDAGYRQSLLEHAQPEVLFVESNCNVKAHFFDSPKFPKRLLECDDSPILLYSIGACDLDQPHVVGIVGTRNATRYGVDFTSRLVKDLAEKLDGLVIVSGLAWGIDVAAHKAAMEANVPTVGIMAHGLQMIYPAEHRSVAAKMIEKGGALVTEYGSQSRITKGNFLARNRIVAGVCDVIVVVESDIRGGSMSTARTAMHYNREVMALPGRINDQYSRGTNLLISNHTASMINCADDLINLMGWTAKTSSKDAQPAIFQPLSEKQQLVYDFIIKNPELTSNDICVRLGMSFAALSNILFELEMNDVIAALPGGRFQAVSKSR